MSVKRPILIMQLRPENETSDNEFDSILKYGQLREQDAVRLRIEAKGIPPTLNLEHYSAIIVGGSPFDISTPVEKKSSIQKKIESDFKQLFDQVVTEDFPFLGACSGNGLLGDYLGSPITRRFGEAVGCVDLDVTEAGKNDPLLQDFPDRITVLLGHKEACEQLPPGATLLVKGDQCPIQMFRLGNNVYATQFHPEGDVEGFTLRIHVYKNHGYFDPDEAEALIEAVSRKPTPHAQQILRRFVGRYLR